jgi:hypothetical protein
VISKENTTIPLPNSSSLRSSVELLHREAKVSKEIVARYRARAAIVGTTTETNLKANHA